MGSIAKGKLIIPCWFDTDEVKPLIDDNGRLPVSLGASGVTLDVNLESSDITLPVAEQSPLTTIQARGYGWNLANWAKLPILWGYNAQYVERLVDTNLGAGTQDTDGTPVATGYVRYVLGASVRVLSATCALIQFLPYMNNALNDLWRIFPPASDILYYVDRQFIMKEGDYIRVRGYTYTAGDDIEVTVWGYKMKIDE